MSINSGVVTMDSPAIFFYLVQDNKWVHAQSIVFIQDLLQFSENSFMTAK